MRAQAQNGISSLSISSAPVVGRFGRISWIEYPTLAIPTASAPAPHQTIRDHFADTFAGTVETTGATVSGAPSGWSDFFLRAASVDVLRDVAEPPFLAADFFGATAPDAFFVVGDAGFTA